MERVKCVGLGSNGCHMQVASARVYEDSDVSVLAEGFFWVGAVQVDVDPVEFRRGAGCRVVYLRG